MSGYLHFVMQRILLLTLLCTAAAAAGAEAPLIIPNNQAARPHGAPPATAPLRPFTAFAWEFPGQYRHVKAMYYISNQTPPGVAAQTTKRMLDGTRVILFRDWTSALLTHPNDKCLTADGKLTKAVSVWPEFGPRAIADQLDDYLQAFQQAGGQIDFVVLDAEDNFSCWVMTDEWLDAIAADPRAPRLIAKLGFSELHNSLLIRSKHGEYLRWNAVLGRVVEDALELAILQPLRRHFPRAGMSNFSGVAMTPQDVVPDVNGHLQYWIGDPPGTHQSPYHYGGAFPPRIKADWNRPFMQVLYAANLVRCGDRNSAHQMIPWIGFKSWKADGDRPTVWGNTPYWEEGAWHMMLSGGTSNLLFFNPKSRTPASTQPAADGGAILRDNDAMEQAMADMEQAAKGSPIVAPLTIEPIAWDAGTIVSAARLADGAALARVTFSERATSISFKLDGKDVTVQRPPNQVGTWVRVPQ